MRDYLNAQEKSQFMVMLSILQMMEGKRNDGSDGPKMGTLREEWNSRNNLSKIEHKSLKSAETWLQKFADEVYGRLSQKEQQIIDKKIKKFDFKLIDDYTLKQINRDIADKFANAVVPRNEFYDWCAEIMTVKCQNCTLDWNTCNLHQVFDNNLVPESGFNCTNCKYAYTS